MCRRCPLPRPNYRLGVSSHKLRFRKALDWSSTCTERESDDCMIRLLIRFLQRFLILALGILSVWLIVFVVFRFADHRLPWILALALTYGIATYLVLPCIVPHELESSSTQKRASLHNHRRRVAR